MKRALFFALVLVMLCGMMTIRTFAIEATVRTEATEATESAEAFAKIEPASASTYESVDFTSVKYCCQQ